MAKREKPPARDLIRVFVALVGIVAGLWLLSVGIDQIGGSQTPPNPSDPSGQPTPSSPGTTLGRGTTPHVTTPQGTAPFATPTTPAP